MVGPPAWIPRHAVGPGYTSYRFAPRLRGWFNANLARFDLAIVHSAWQYPGHALRRACKRMHKPYFVYPHGSIDPAHRLVFPRKHMQKLLMWRMEEHRLFEDASGIIYTGEKERDLAPLAYLPRLSNRNAFVIPYCTGEPPTDHRKQEEAFCKAFPQIASRDYVLFLSRVHHKKGVDVLLEAFAQVYSEPSDPLLVIAGPGEEAYLRKLKSLAVQLVSLSGSSGLEC